MAPETALLDLFLILFGYGIAILSRFRILIWTLQFLIFGIKLYQWAVKHRVEIDEKIQVYIKNLKRAEKMIFPLVFYPFRRRKKRRVQQAIAEMPDND